MNTCSSLCHKDEPCSVTADGKCDASQTQPRTTEDVAAKLHIASLEEKKNERDTKILIGNCRSL